MGKRKRSIEDDIISQVFKHLVDHSMNGKIKGRAARAAASRGVRLDRGLCEITFDILEKKGKIRRNIKNDIEINL